MDPDIAPFLRFTEHDLRPDTPHIVVELEPGGPKLTEDTECCVLVTLRRVRDEHEGSCMFQWHPFSNGFAPLRFVLLRHTANGFQKIDIEGEPHPEPEKPIGLHKPTLRVLAPESKVRIMESLTHAYRKELVLGEKYELVWPGGEIALWDWGTPNQYPGRELHPKSPKICLPGARITLEVGEKEERRGSPEPIDPSKRVSGAPILNVTLESETTKTLRGKLDMKTSVVYEAPPGSPPITFHSDYLRWYNLYRRRGDKWELIEDDTTGFMIVDEPDVAVNVSQSEYFTSLQPGQAWTTSFQFQGQGKDELPLDMTVGDVFRYRFMGGKLDWWDWGDKSKHSETTVILPCYIQDGWVKEPKDNGGRPKLVVPGSNFVEFTII